MQKLSPSSFLKQYPPDELLKLFLKTEFIYTHFPPNLRQLS